ncbi:hypothetical protein ScalyP_jg2286 [Parmales sp. scaly parma]|nr:hypothetical protein ScalyP_jg2286 [Parmales sp. scaly parma]
MGLRITIFFILNVIHISQAFLRIHPTITNNIPNPNPSSLLFIRVKDGHNKAFDDDDVINPYESSRHPLSLLNSSNFLPALVLNADYQPLSLVPVSVFGWQAAVKAVVSGRVKVVDSYDITIRSPNYSLPLPSVIALNTFHSKASSKAVSFSRCNVYLRDGYKCQYCDKKYRHSDLSLDHVHPRAQGGRLDWTNVVTCCRTCNGRKGELPLNKLASVGMKLVRKPRAPTVFELSKNSYSLNKANFPPSWQPFLPQ